MKQASSYALNIKDTIDLKEEQFLDDGLTANAVENGVIVYKETPLSIVERDEHNNIIGGLIAKTTNWGWLEVKILWVDKDKRGQGLGSALLLEAEKESISRGCHSVCLWTEDYEGETFYPKFGYKVFVDQADFPIGHRRIGFMKRLDR